MFVLEYTYGLLNLAFDEAPSVPDLRSEVEAIEVSC